ncbi:MAG: ABC transporter substrate-binding protein [Ilumatobacteraceae bacterium]
MRGSRTIVAAISACALMLAACGGDDDDSSDTTSAPAPTTAAPDETDAPPETTAESPDTTEASPDTTEASPDTTEPAAEAWAVNTDDCVDPDAANAPIEGTVNIGSAMPLTGGVAAAAFAPVKGGFEAYVAYARENGLFEGYDDINLTIADDQYDPAQTPGAVASQIDAGAHLFSGIIGSPNNGAVRDTLNDECIPQLNALTGSPAWGQVEDYPWTTGILVPYTVESKVYATQIGELYPDGASVGMFYVNNDFGQVYVDAFNEIAGDYNLEIVTEQTVEATDSNPPTSQVTNIANEQPDVIMAVPLGAGCISFLTELAAAKAQNAGWDPAVFITNTCASSLILGAAGPAADGLYTSNNLLDIGNPEVQTMPVVADYIAFMEGQGLGDIITTGAAGWTTGEITVAILNQAAQSPEGLTRASIINAARTFTHTPSLGREGVVDKTMGVEDPYLSETLQVLQYDADTATFTDIGSLITEFES